MRKYIIGWSMLLLLMMCMGMTVQGAVADEDALNGCTLTVTSGSDLSQLNVTADGTRYSVGSFSFANGGSGWKPGEIPKLIVIVNANEGYYFGSKVSTGKITIKGGGTCSSVRRIDSGAAIEVTIRLKAVKGEMGPIEEAFWVASPIGKAKWDSAENAGAYELRLYCGNTLVKVVGKTITTTYDFYPYMTKQGDYYFKVRPIPKNANESEYLTVGEWVASNELPIDRTNVAPEGGNQSASSDTSLPDLYDKNHVPFGWVMGDGGWWYHEKDGSYPVNRWSYIDNKWYLFDLGGYMKTGWQLWNDKYYYLTSNGDMVTGWMESNRKWYYLEPSDGHMLTGWAEAGGKKYYLNQDGSRASGWSKISSAWYYFSPDDGTMAVNATIGSYYVNGDGIWVQ